MEDEDSKKLSKVSKKGIKVISEMSTFSIVLFLLKKHKTALFATWAVIITLMWAFPQWPQFIGAIFLS